LIDNLLKIRKCQDAADALVGCWILMAMIWEI